MNTPTRIKLTHLNSLASYENVSVSRLQALYADISRQKHSNPPSYQSTVQWWHQTIQSVILKGWIQQQSSDYMVLHANPSLADSFRYEGVGKPLCLATVIAELCEAKAYIPLNQFLHSAQSVYDSGWLPLRIASYIVGKPLLWALRQLNVVSTDEGGHESDIDRWKKVKGDYVLLNVVESASQNVIAAQRNRGPMALVDRLYTVDSFRKEFAGIALPDVVLSDLDIKTLLKYLERDSGVIIVEKEVIKFIDQESTEPQTITAVDHGILELKIAIQNLQTQITNIQQKILERNEKASIALRQTRKEVALSHLRSRRQLEDLLSKRVQALDNLESTLLTVERAAGDVEIMKSYESSTTTLRNILSHPSLQREKIEETMDAMFSATKDAQDIDETIRLTGDVSDQVIDEEDLEAELKALVGEAERETAEAADTLRVEKQQRAAASDGRRDAWAQARANTDTQGTNDTEEDMRTRDKLAGREASMI